MRREEQTRKDWGMSDREDPSELESGEISIGSRESTEHDPTCSCSWV